MLLREEPRRGHVSPGRAGWRWGLHEESEPAGLQRQGVGSTGWGIACSARSQASG